MTIQNRKQISKLRELLSAVSAKAFDLSLEQKLTTEQTCDLTLCIKNLEGAYKRLCHL